MDAFAGLLNGEPIGWSAIGMSADDFLRACHDRDLIGLIEERARSGGTAKDWPANVRDALAATARTETAKELLRRQEIIAVLSALADQGIRPIITKGTALAYGVYKNPIERPRLDTDLLIRGTDVENVRTTLARLGYAAPAYCDGDLFGQFPMKKTDAFKVTHVFDFHWKLSTQPVFADVLDYDEVDRAAVDLPALGPYARTTGAAHSLLLACIHPVMHHRNAELLIWIYDIHLLASRLTDSEFDRFADFAVARRVSAICARELALARDRFSTRIPESVLARLDDVRREPSSEYLRPNRRWRHELVSSLRALPGWRARARLLREVMFPSAGYMFASYNIKPSALALPLLPLLVLHRLGVGVWKIVSGRK